MAERMRFLPAGSDAVLVELPNLDRTLALFDTLQAIPPAGVGEIIPAARTLLVRFDPHLTDRERLADAISSARVSGGGARQGEVFNIPVTYDGEDLQEIAGIMGLPEAEVIRRHTEATYTVAFTGFAPGFAYMTCDDPAFDVPRRQSPRTRIPAGSVALAGRFGGIYPSESPGGWQLLGRTPLAMWDLNRPRAALLAPGDRVRFRDMARGATVPVMERTAQTPKPQADPDPGLQVTEAFGRGDCYAEQFLDRPRHIEAQVLADTHGNTVVLGTRDCSLQRRNQKLVEEAPAPFISEEQRARIHEAARAICAEAGYVGAGTVEFLLSREGVISFLEVNTRLQVEHPVTEETAGIDIVVEQLRIADGLPLSVTETPEPCGHAFEFRINAEDPGRGFLPTPGRISRFRAPSGPGIRLDTGVESGSEIPGLYDSMMAKLIVTGPTRDAALIRARRALAEFRIEGVASVLPFHRAVLDEPAFTAEAGFKVHTNWIETEFPELAPAPRVDPSDPALLRSFIEIDGKRHAIALPAALFAGLASPQSAAVDATVAVEIAVTAPIPGTLQQWLVEDGSEVAEGEAVAVIEAMKMETRISAPSVDFHRELTRFFHRELTHL